MIWETDALNPAFWDSATAHVLVPEGQEPDASLVRFLETHPKTCGKGILAFQTSGSTGTPKWVLIHKPAFLASAQAVNAHLQSNKQDRWMIPLPRHHVAGFSILARCYLSGAQYQIYEGSWDAHRFVQELGMGQCTITSLVPTQVYDLVKAQLRPPNLLRAILVGGGGMNPEIRAAAIRLGWPLLQTFGMTEASSGIATESVDENFPEIEAPLQVLRIWNLQLAPSGALLLQGDALAKGYAKFENQQWIWEEIPASGLLTRDRVTLSEKSDRVYLKFQGRDHAFVKVKGELIHLGTIQSRWESRVFQSPLEGSSVIIALPDERRDEKLVLVVENRVPLEEVYRVLEQFHTQSPKGEKVHEIRWVEQIPKSALGKLQLAELKSLLA